MSVLVGGPCQVSPFVPPGTTPDLLWSLGLADATPRFTGETSSGWMAPPCPLRLRSCRITAVFVVDLYVGLPHAKGSGRLGTSPVKLTNHFPEVNPPTTLTLDWRLTVFADSRRSIEG